MLILKKKIEYLLLLLFVLSNGLGFTQISVDEIQKVVSSDRATLDLFGTTVAVSGDYMVVGANLEDEDGNGANTIDRSGSAYIYERDAGGSWNEVQKIVASDRAYFDYFAYSVAISGNYMVIGSHQEDEDENGANTEDRSGSAYIFERDAGGTWSEVQKIIASDRAEMAYFGWNVSISGDYLVVGAYGEKDDENGANSGMFSGAAYVFERDAGGSWNEVQKLVASDRASLDNFGRNVSISGNYLVVGAMDEDEDVNGANTLNRAGSAYIFERDAGGTWNEVQKIVASDRGLEDHFGNKLSISGNYLVVGAEYDNEGSGVNTISEVGSAYVFERDGGGIWNEVQKIVAPERYDYDHFASSVSISGDYIVVGAMLEDEDENEMNSIANSGSAYIYKREVGGVWGLVQKFVASDRSLGDDFGTSISISDNVIAVGARSENEDENGANTMDDAGSVYIFGITLPCDIVTGANIQSTTCGEDNGQVSFIPSGGDDGPYTVTWSGGEEQLDSLGMSQGSYLVTIADGSGCDLDTTFVIASSSSISHTMSQAEVSCFGDSDGTASVSVTGGITPYVYLWSNSENTASIGNVSAGVYTVTVTDSVGCVVVDSVTVMEPVEIAVSITSTPSACLGDDSFDLTAVPSGGVWQGVIIDHVINGTVVLDTVGSFEVTYTIEADCADPDTIDFVVNELPEIELSIQNISCSGMGDGTLSATVNNTSEESYLWSTGETTSSISDLIPGVYQLTVASPEGCSDTISSTIEPSIEECLDITPHYFLPNIFSPNGDGQNDFFYLRGEGIEYFQLGIYDRWGELVFETESLNEGWNGTFNGEPMNPDVFIYRVDIVYEGGSSEGLTEYGNVTLVR